MHSKPKLSLCVPSRNRQVWFRQTISDLTANPRPDIEFVFADKSDDPDQMDDFMRGLDDPRIVYLPSQAAPLSMADNWERTVAATSGAWVTVIGDDDFCASDLVDYISAIEARDPDVDAIAWNRTPFQWPDARQPDRSVPISLANRIIRHPHAAILARMFGWEGASYVPMCPYTIYHGAISRAALERVKGRFSGRCFEHPVVDYDFAHKLLASSENLVYIDRPMSVLGVAKASNSAAVGNQSGHDRALGEYHSENGTVYDDSAREEGFPFAPKVGVTAAIMLAQHYFKLTYNYSYPDWQPGFARAVNNECSLWTRRDEFDEHVRLLREVFEVWEGGKYLPLFQPRFVGETDAPGYLGIDGDRLHIAQEIGGAVTPADFYGIFSQMLPPRAEVPIEF